MAYEKVLNIKMIPGEKKSFQMTFLGEVESYKF